MQSLEEVNPTARTMPNRLIAWGLLESYSILYERAKVAFFVRL
jgi:hypothetical protein